MKSVNELQQELFAQATQRTRIPPSVIKALMVLLALALAFGLWFWWPRGQDETFELQLGDPSAAEQALAAEVPPENEAASIADGTTFDQQAPGEQTPASTVFVYVSGAVASPGVYELLSSARVNDAVIAAGGMLDGAAGYAVNLAAPVADGMQIHIVTQDEVALGTAPLAGTATATSSAATNGAATGAAPAQGKVNINTADAATLETLSGVGPATAQKIIQYRTANGPFRSIEDLKNVSGIGEKKYAQLADSICVG